MITAMCLFLMWHDKSPEEERQKLEKSSLRRLACNDPGVLSVNTALTNPKTETWSTAADLVIPITDFFTNSDTATCP